MIVPRKPLRKSSAYYAITKSTSRKEQQNKGSNKMSTTLCVSWQLDALTKKALTSLSLSKTQGKYLQNTNIQQLFQGYYKQHEERVQQYPYPRSLHPYQEFAELLPLSDFLQPDWMLLGHKHQILTCFQRHYSKCCRNTKPKEEKQELSYLKQLKTD